MCTIQTKATKRRYENNILQVVDNEQYFVILPNAAKQDEAGY